MDILASLQFNEERPSVLALSNSDRQQTIAIALVQGQILKKHISATPAMIIVLKGRILFETEEESTVVEEMNTFQIPPSVPHEVTGLEKTIFLLIKDKV